jgi:hypothetical protein
MYYYDSTYILVLAGMLLCMLASFNVSNTFKKYSRVGNRRGYTAQDVAREILHRAGIYDVQIQRVGGDMTDHYSPKEKVLRLSDTVYNSTSVAAIGVAAHECGHAIQDQRHYVPMTVRSAVIPAANIGANLSYPIILAGLFFALPNLVEIGALLFSLVVLAQLVTLPVEFDASARALRILKNEMGMEPDEVRAAGKVLTAAALTYVASLVSSALQLLRLFLLSGRRRD